MAQTLISRALSTLPVGITRVWLRRILLGNLIAQVGIVLTGGVVRLTGSGLGCPTFPQCVPGSYTPVVNQTEGIHKYIEFGNRMLTTVVTALAVAALLAVLRQVRAGQGGRRLLTLGATPFLGVMAQALIGGITVLTQLNPTVVAVHFLVSMALIAGSTLLLLVALREFDAAEPHAATSHAAASHATEPGAAASAPAADPEPAPVPVLGRYLVAAAAIVSVAVLTLGTLVTGSGPHSGDAEDPNRFSFAIPVVTRMHSAFVWLFVLLVIALVVTLARSGAPAQARRWSLALLLVTLAQGLVGYVQYALGVPAWLVGVHMLGAAGFVIATTGTAYAVLRRRPVPAGSGTSYLPPVPAST